MKKYTKEEILKAAEIGEVSMIDAKYVVSLLDEARTKMLCSIVLDVLREWHRKETGWWYGYDYLIDDIQIKTGEVIPLTQIKQALKELRKQGLIKVEVIYKEENGMLNGSGYFYNGA